MPPRKNHPTKSKPGLVCGLEIPSFLKPYQDMLGEGSVFKDQVKREREEEEEKVENPTLYSETQDKSKDTNQKQVEVGETAHISEKNAKRLNNIKSNKNNSLIRELTKKMTGSSQSSNQKEKSVRKEKQNTIRKSGTTKKKEVPEALKQQKKGMLSFDADSDSDQLYMCLTKT